MATAWKIFDLHVDGQPRFLFHGLRGKRGVPLNVTMTAEKKIVRNGGKNSKYYTSGFHCYPDIASCQKWLKAAKLKTKRVIVPVTITGSRKKTHSVWPCLLADTLRVDRLEWIEVCLFWLNALEARHSDDKLLYNQYIKPARHSVEDLLLKHQNDLQPA